MMDLKHSIVRTLLLIGGMAMLGGCVRIDARPDQDLPGIVLAESNAIQPEFERALASIPVELPKDHGPHLNFQTEWWYYTGNLETESGRHFGFQFTIFRRGLEPGQSVRTSSFGTTQIYFAHLALTDVERGVHISMERFSRGAGGLAGGVATPFRIWVGDWSVESMVQDGSKVHLTARDAGVVLDLVLTAEKPLVMHGDSGLSAKGDKAGNASYYLSYTRMGASGVIETNGDRYNVEGSSWFDHEWSTSALDSADVGWDWFGLQLDDGRELMLYRIRREDGTIEPISGGTLVEADGSTISLAVEDIALEVMSEWESPTSGSIYPSAWRIRIPLAGIDLEITPFLADQEMKVSFTYWEGAVAIQGKSGGEPVSGWGYVELTGYLESMAGVL